MVLPCFTDQAVSIEAVIAGARNFDKKQHVKIHKISGMKYMNLDEGPEELLNRREKFDFKRSVCTRLREARVINGLSLTEASIRFGFANPGSLSKIESGKHINEISLDFIAMAAKIYEVTTDWLLCLVEASERNPKVRMDADATDWLYRYMEDARIRDMTVVRAFHEELRHVTAATDAVCKSVAEVEEACLVMRKHHSNVFANLRGGAMLKRTIETASELAMAARNRLSNYRQELHKKTITVDRKWEL